MKYSLTVIVLIRDLFERHKINLLEENNPEILHMKMYNDKNRL